MHEADSPAAAPDDEDDDLPALAAAGGLVEVALGPDDAGLRLDKALADHAADLSRARIQALLEAGAVTLEGQPVRAGSAKARPGLYRIEVPAPAPDIPEPEAIPLGILFEDAHLIVVDKPAGMAVHPGPGSEYGTLVAALLHHCAGQLSGIGGVARPGIVHRLDKDTSGVMVAAKSDRAHQGLSALFAAHDIERKYTALTRGVPRPKAGRIASRLGRSHHDRKKMAVLKTGGREAITDYEVEQVFGGGERPPAARVGCRLHTGRTHQIRVHMASKGTPCLGDVTYGSGGLSRPLTEALRASGLERQALHASVLGFVHPITGERLRFDTDLPADMAALVRELEAL